jgi:tetratricopeptide (TPR) repeat protein
MDLLDFEAGQLYFDEPIDQAAKDAIEDAAELYGKARAEQLLLRAYFLEPEHPLVLVALYRYFYYQHRFDDAIRVAERVLRLFAKRLGFPEDWRELDRPRFENGVLVSMTMLRFYLLALKGAGYLELRLGKNEEALQRLYKVVELDDNDRMGAQALIDVTRYSAGLRAVPESA